MFSAVLAQPPEVDPRYHTYDEVLSEVGELADEFPSICHVETLGQSTQDSLPIVGVRLSDNASLDEPEPCVLLVGGQHAREPAGTEVVMWLLRYLTSHYGVDERVTKWLDSLQIWLIPVDNPEGRQVVMTEGPQHTIHWRKNKRDNNGNGVFDTLYDGVDPNRNYEFRWDEYDVTDPQSENYKGPYPWSEQEAVVLRDLIDYYRPSVVLDLHSPDSMGGNKLWFCWWDVDAGSYHGEGYPHYALVAWDLADNTETEVAGEHYECRAAYNTKPKLQTWAYWYTGCCAILMEITNKCFWHGDTIDTIAARVGRGIFYVFDRMFEKGLLVRAYDAGTGEPLPAVVVVEGVTDTTFPPRTCSFQGIYHRFLEPGEYTVRVSYDTLELVFSDVVIEPGHNTVLDAPFELAGVSDGGDLGGAPGLFATGEQVVFRAPAGTARIYDILGREVVRRPVLGELRVKLGDLPTGLYVAELVTRRGRFVRKRLCVVR